MIEALLAQTGHGIETLADGVSKVTVDLGQGRTMPLMAFHHAGLLLDDDRLVRLCGHTGLSIDDPDLFLLIERASDFAVGGFMTPQPNGSILFTYTSYVDGLDAPTLALLCTALAWTVHAMQAGPEPERRGPPPPSLVLPARPPIPVDVRAMLQSLTGGKRVFRDADGGVEVRVRLGEKGVAFAAPPADGEEGDDGIDVRIVTTDMALLHLPLVMVCTPMASVDGPPEVAAQLARRLLELNAHLQVGKFFSTQERLILFGHTALGRVLTPERLARVIALVAETASSAPDALVGEEEGSA